MPLILIAFGAYLWWTSRTNRNRVRVDIGPARIKERDVHVEVGPAKILSPHEISKVRVSARSPHDDAILIAQSAREAGIRLPDTALAKRDAQGVADMVRMKGANYDPHVMQAWQLAAGTLSRRGAYDRETQKALVKFGAARVARKVYERSNKAPYRVIPAGV